MNFRQSVVKTKQRFFCGKGFVLEPVSDLSIKCIHVDVHNCARSTFESNRSWEFD